MSDDERMSHLRITVEPMAGSRIEGCCEMAQAISRLTGQTVDFNFNDDPVHCHPTDTTARSAAEVWALKRELRIADERTKS
jgi:hypothetical protein